MQSIQQKRIAKRMKELQPKGRTFIGIDAVSVAIHTNELAPKDYSRGFFGARGLFDHSHKLRLNQRQKRKRAKQANRKLKR
jgi:hypothetical protein